MRKIKFYLEGWSKSKGSRAELKYAYDSGISVIYWGTGDWRSDRGCKQ